MSFKSLYSSTLYNEETKIRYVRYYAMILSTNKVSIYKGLSIHRYLINVTPHKFILHYLCRLLCFSTL
jgi:hypothetical protein